ncbi:MAG: hypothetical protein AAGA76_00940 [Pseudomonadota bacterium]
MIRGFFITFACLFVLVACATGKAVKFAKVYAPAEFQITDISVDVPADTINQLELRELFRNSATNLALAYNDAMPLVAPAYVMEVSVQSYKAQPASEAGLRYRVIVRNQVDGTEFRALPAAFSNAGGEIPQARMEEGLIGQSLPEVFYRLYGLSDTPASVKAEVSGETLFTNPSENESVVPAAYSSPVAVSTPQPASGGEPTVISCDVC